MLQGMETKMIKDVTLSKAALDAAGRSIFELAGVPWDDDLMVELLCPWCARLLGCMSPRDNSDDAS